MCENNSANTSTIPTTGSSFWARRSSIWDLPPHLSCPVIGTCINVSELKRLKIRFKKQIGDVQFESDYDLHSYFVSASTNKNVISVHINKTLNNQYQRFINEIKTKKNDEQIESVWELIVPSDLHSLAGYFWAIVTSKYASEQLKDKVYGEIHMISHIAGQSNKIIEQNLINEKHKVLLDNVKKDRSIDSKNNLIEGQRILIDELRQRNAQITLQLSGLQIKNQSPGLSTEDYQHQLADQQHNIYRLQKRINQLEKKRETEPKQKIAYNLKDQISTPLKPLQIATESCDGNCKKCKSTDLCGKKILYVGGFSRHRNKFQQLTQSINGEFYYHDGGKQQSEHQLTEMVKKVDCIFCPVDCISHSAVDRIKTLAKSHCKDCVFLRSASLSSFNTGIRAYAS